MRLLEQCTTMAHFRTDRVLGAGERTLTNMVRDSDIGRVARPKSRDGTTAEWTYRHLDVSQMALLTVV